MKSFAGFWRDGAAVQNLIPQTNDFTLDRIHYQCVVAQPSLMQSVADLSAIRQRFPRGKVEFSFWTS